MDGDAGQVRQDLGVPRRHRHFRGNLQQVQSGQVHGALHIDNAFHKEVNEKMRGTRFRHNFEKFKGARLFEILGAQDVQIKRAEPNPYGS